MKRTRFIGSSQVSSVGMGLCAFAFAILGLPRNAHAQQYDCTSAGHACDGGENYASGGWGVAGIATAGLGVYGLDLSSGNGVEGDSSSGRGVFGQSATGTGVKGLITGSSGNAILGSITGTSTGDGVLGSVGSSGNGVEGNNSGSGAGISAHNTGTGNGLYVSASGNTGIVAYGSGDAIYGESTAGVGVYGRGPASSTAPGWGLEGYGYSTSGGSSGIGVYAFGNGANAYGVQASCSGTGCAAIDALGDINYTGSLNHISDERLKRDIVPLRASLDKLEQLKPVSFYWKDPSQHGNTDTVQRGFIAQDYEKVFPEWVKTNRDGYKMIDTTGLDALEVDSIVQLKDENDQLKKRLDTLEASRRVVVAGNAWGFAIGGLALGLGMVITQRKKKDETKDEG